MIKPTGVYILLVSLLAILPAMGQSPNFSIQNTDASAYPAIRTTIQVNGNAKPQASDFKVLEDRKEIDFNLISQEDGANKAIFFLVEASGLTYGRASDNIKNALKDALEAVSANTLVNIGYFGRPDRDNQSINVLSAEFTTDVQALKAEISREINPPSNSDAAPEVYKAMYQALDFMEAKQNLPADKRLIVISTAINNNRSPIKADDVIEKANRLKIPVYTIAYKTGNRYAPDNFVRISDRTNGQTTIDNTLPGINSAIRGYIDRAGAVASSNDNTYVIEFTSTHPANGKIHQYEIRYRGERLAATYTSPVEKEGFLASYGTYIFLVALLIGGILAWLLYRTRRAKTDYESTKQQEQQERLRQAEKEQPTSTQAPHGAGTLSRQAPPNTVPRKNNLRNTVIADSGSALTLSITSGDFKQMVNLDKPQITIGRSPGNDVVIPEQTVSGKHAVITNEGGSLYISDVGSTNGTYVNMILISGKQRINPGDTIKMGAAQAKIQG